jgi:hypothetical protein
MASKQHNSDHSIIAANADAADLFKRFKRFAYGSKSQAPLPESGGAPPRAEVPKPFALRSPLHGESAAYFAIP